MGLGSFPGKFSVRVWSLVVICAEMSKKHDQTCPNLLTIQWQCTLSSQCLFCTFECSYSSVLRPILLKLHTLIRLIESFPTVDGLWSCIEIEMSIPLYRSLETVDRKSFEHRNFLVLRPVPLKIAYFNSANRRLSIDVHPKELRQRKIVDPSRAAP